MKVQGHEIIFKTLVGSHSYGTNIEGSDTDYKGVYIQDPEDVYYNGYKQQIDVTKDEVYYEVGRFLSLCTSGNPTMLEVLYAPKECIVHITPVFREIMKIRDVFLTKSLRHSFGGYAIEQIRKAGGLNKKMNWEKGKVDKKSVEEMCYIYPLNTMIPNIDIHCDFISKAIKLLEWTTINNFDKDDLALVNIEHFRDSYLVFHSTTNHKFKGITSGVSANEVTLSDVDGGEVPLAILFFHKDAYSTACKEWRDYENWLKERNEQRYVDIEGHGQKIDGKNILHCIRVIETAMEIPLLKSINVKRANSDFLIEIRKGKHDLKKLLSKSETDLKIMDEAFIKSDLPDRISEKDKEMLKDLAFRIKREFYENSVIENGLKLHDENGMLPFRDKNGVKIDYERADKN
jgi:hypothetical protein